MTNVETFKLNDRADEADVREDQQQLIEAEIAVMDALAATQKATAASVSFIRKLGLSVVHPSARKLLQSIPELSANAATLPLQLSECHRLAERMAKASDKKVVMSGGTGKDAPPERNVDPVDVPEFM